MDVVLRRAPFDVTSAAVLHLSAQRHVDGVMSGHSVTTIAYFVRRRVGTALTRPALRELLSQVRVAPVGETEVQGAMASAVDDFEDAVVEAVAREVGAALIVTRNLKDFAKSTIPALSPEAFLAQESSGA